MLKNMQGQSARTVPGTDANEAVLSVANAAVQRTIYDNVATPAPQSLPVLGFGSFVFTFTGTVTIGVKGSTDNGKTWKTLAMMDMSTGGFEILPQTNDQTRVWMIMCAGLTHVQIIPTGVTGNISLSGTLN